MAVHELSSERTATASVDESTSKTTIAVVNMSEPEERVQLPQSKSWQYIRDSEAGASSKQIYPPLLQPVTKSDKAKSNRILTDEEKVLIGFLEGSFNTALKTPFAAEVPSLLEEMQDYYQTFASGYAKKVIKFVKCVNDFSQLDMDLKVNCLKESMGCCLVLVAAYDFDNSEKCFIVNDIKVRVDNLKKAFAQHKDSTELLINHVLSMQNTLFKDPCVMAMFTVILVFSPFWENLIQRRHLSNIQNKYLILLKHYLEANYSYGKGKEYFVFILQKLNSLRELKRQRQAVVAELRDTLSPFAKEIFQ